VRLRGEEEMNNKNIIDELKVILEHKRTDVCVLRRIIKELENSEVKE
jgi:hypothetical protein